MVDVASRLAAERVRNCRERGGERRLDIAQARDHDQSHQRADQAVFDCGDAGFIGGETAEEGGHDDNSVNRRLVKYISNALDTNLNRIKCAESDGTVDAAAASR